MCVHFAVLNAKFIRMLPVSIQEKKKMLNLAQIIFILIMCFSRWLLLVVECSSFKMCWKWWTMVCVCVCVLLRHHMRSFYCTVLNELQDSELQYSVSTSPSSLGHMQQAVIAPLLGLMWMVIWKGLSKWSHMMLKLLRDHLTWDADSPQGERDGRSWSVESMNSVRSRTGESSKSWSLL